MKNQEKMNQKYKINSKLNDFKSSSFIMRPDRHDSSLQNVRESNDNSQQILDLNNMTNEDSKLIEEEDSLDDDEQFYDALDEYDKNLYQKIKTNRSMINQDEVHYEGQPNEHSEPFKRKMLMI